MYNVEFVIAENEEDISFTLEMVDIPRTGEIVCIIKGGEYIMYTVATVGWFIRERERFTGEITRELADEVCTVYLKDGR